MPHPKNPPVLWLPNPRDWPLAIPQNLSSPFGAPLNWAMRDARTGFTVNKESCQVRGRSVKSDQRRFLNLEKFDSHSDRFSVKHHNSNQIIFLSSPTSVLLKIAIKMTKLGHINELLLSFLCMSAVYPAFSMSRWFSSSYHDLRFTLRRYGHCVGDLAPLKDHYMNESEYLMNQMREFLNQGSYDNEQLANVSALMDNICRSDEKSYPISMNIDIGKYNSTAGKENRCGAIDEAMDAMYAVFKRASYNKSEPLDFSVIQFYPNPANKALSYNLTDLINTSWIKSETILENVCNITDSVKGYVSSRISNSAAQDRSQQQHTGVFNSLLDMIDRILDPILGLQRRLYWESNNRLELAYSSIDNQFNNFRGAISSGYKSIVNRFTSSTNSTISANSTKPDRVMMNTNNQTIDLKQRFNV